MGQKKLGNKNFGKSQKTNVTGNKVLGFAFLGLVQKKILGGYHVTIRC